MRIRLMLLAVVFALAPVTLPAQEAVSLGDLPTLSDDGTDFCSVLREQKESGLSDADRQVFSAELRRRSGFSAADRSLLVRSDREIGNGMTLQGLKCALGEQVRVVHVWDYGSRATWQVELYPRFWRYNIRHVYLYGNGRASGMRLGSMPVLTLRGDS